MMVIDFLKSIRIGKRCDGGVSDVRIDVSAWRKMYPELTDYRIEVTSPDKVVYIADTRMEGDVLIWDIRQSDTATEGRGEYQVVATGADGQRLTAGPADVTVARIMDGTAQDTPPDYAQPWLDSVSASAKRAEDAADRAKQEVLDGLAEAKQSGEFDGADGKDGQGSGASVQADLSVNDESDPAYVKNRTHWLERPYEPIVWNGSTEGRESIDLSATVGEPAGTTLVYKISDLLFTSDFCAESKVYATENGVTHSGTLSIVTEYTPNAVWVVKYVTKDEGDNDFVYGQLYVFAVAGDFTSEFGIVVPSAGTYADQMKFDAVLDINADVYHTLDSHYLPDTYATKDYVDNLITGAIGGSY